jgi:type III secretion protein W
MSDPNISNILPISNQSLRFIQQEAKQLLAKTVASEGSLSQYVENTLFNPSEISKRFQDLKHLKTAQKEQVDNPEEEHIKSVESSEETASRFQKNNPELQSKTLAILQSLISPSDSPEETLAKVLSVYPDASLADEALDFLIETASESTLEMLKNTKQLLHEKYERQIRAGRNISIWAREFSKEGLGSPTALRDMYRDVTGNRRDPLQLFDELAEKFPYAKLKSVITFLLHSLGSDLKSKGPSIERGDLARLIEETRSLQGILGIFRFFQSRTKLMERQFQSFDFVKPSQLNFESLSRLLVKMLAERYINQEKILQTALLLGISEKKAAQIITYSQMYDALRQISPKYYRNPQHRNELSKAFLNTLEQLEKDMEEENKEKKKKKHEKKHD